jgi:hypothetical protein
MAGFGFRKKFGPRAAAQSESSSDPAFISSFTFLQVADYYLVTHALAQGHTIVTHEIAENTTNRVKIPNVCIGLGVKSMTPFEMLRTERARFVLGPLK